MEKPLTADLKARSPHEYLPALTGLRFFAALMVVLSHFFYVFAGYGANYFRSGYGGVTVFFVLSGFVIAWNYSSELQAPRLSTIWNYFVARLARIYPLYLFVLAWVALQSPEIPTSTVVLHALMLQAWSTDLSIALVLNAPAWSVSIELFFYALAPLLFVLMSYLKIGTSVGRLTASVTIILVLMFVAAAGVPDGVRDGEALSHIWLYRHPLPRIGDFLLGILAAKLYAIISRSNYDRRPWTIALYASGTGIILAMRYLYSNPFSWDFAYAILSFFLILGLALSDKSILNSLLSTPTMVLLGNSSYALYLLHVTIGTALRPRTGLATMPTIITGVLLVVILVALSIGMHLLIEKPARRSLYSLLSVRRASPVSSAKQFR